MRIYRESNRHIPNGDQHNQVARHTISANLLPLLSNHNQVKKIISAENKHVKAHYSEHSCIYESVKNVMRHTVKCWTKALKGSIGRIGFPDLIP